MLTKSIEDISQNFSDMDVCFEENFQQIMDRKVSIFK